jgi:hypothetical protein
VREKRILLALVLFMLSAGFLQVFLYSTSLDQCATESDTIDETMVDSVAESAFFSQFYENKGQLNTKDVMFYGRMPGGMIGFGVGRIYLWMQGTDSYVYLSFVGADNITPTGLDEVDRHTSYFLGDRGTYTGIRGYSQIAYEDLWPGIDLYYHVTIDGVKYEFRVAAGSNPNDIRVRCEGHNSLVVGESMVCISNGNGTFVDEGLRAFQDLTDVDVTFYSHGPFVFGFKMGEYDESKDLIIDPLVYSTFVGGSEYDWGSSIAVDSSGNAFVTGGTSSPEFPTVNAYNSTYGGSDDWGGDCFVFKLSADGSTLLYSTFIGGRNHDWASSIAVDTSGNAYVAGGTESPDFPSVNAYDSTYGGGNMDCFVFKLSADGSTLLYSTFVGGSDGDVGNSIAVDSSGNAYVTGGTESPDFPTVNAYNSTHGGGSDDWGGDCFVLKLSADGSTLLYSTFIGGRNHDWASSIAVDSSGNAYVTGDTSSPDFLTVNAYNSTYGGGDDCFVFKLSANGSTLLYSTFIGGSEYDWASSIAVDSSGNAYVTGWTESPDFPTVRAYNSTYGGGGGFLAPSGDCFVFKLSSNGSTLLYSTFIGGSEYDWASSIAVDSSGNAFVAGYTESPDFPTANAYNSTYGGGDCFVLKLIISDYTPDFYYIVASGILQLLHSIYQVALGAINLFALGLVLFTPAHLIRMLISRPTTDITGIPPPDHKRLTCQLCGATYLYGPQHLVNPEVLRCQNCDREFLSKATSAPEESVAISHVRVPIAYMLLSRLRGSRWNIFRRKEESE